MKLVTVNSVKKVLFLILIHTNIG